MLPTFVIGLREGLEAVLIVTIVATFLRQNRASLRGMWLGVGAGVLLSIAVGVVLETVEQSLPQAQQEMLETVIGAVAVFFVTGMILWMRTHARTLKKELEAHAAQAIASGTTTALAVMAFLAVLREGFETSVFLLATFQHATSAPAAVSGAVLGVACSIVLGWAMYAGGVRLNLQRFFTITGVFLVFVAAGLVLFAFRTAHEAGWVNVGQGRTVDLTWLAPNGSIRSALITGVLGIPADPRVIEVLAWAAYLVPMLALMFWPAALAPGAKLAQRLRVGGAALAALIAVVLFALVQRPTAHLATEAPDTTGATVSIAVTGDTAAIERDNHTYALGSPTATSEHGADTRWSAEHVRGDLPATLTLQGLLDFNGGRIPNGLSVATAKGPFTATWTDSTTLTAFTRDGGLVNAELGGTLLLRYSGGGLTTPRILTVDGWQLSPTYVDAVRASLAETDSARHSRELWKTWVPISLLLTSLGLLVQAARRRRSSNADRARGLTPPPAAEMLQPAGSARSGD
ncbi:iron uptake transporter permease EfeU [Nocardioides sp. Kera G14]|uniref:iron uptake transporter permease EfeU n=1 Tax=Nocardioides sp. Kera G14 TaxID=2884264 RepID=UPI001D125397|nr:iron uptake transporter permease EfeU [Nocardioides sp. Kera G14]UDY22721.1 FTR1 family protein [Nocardioides sp. Kera G14]